jgi:phosphoenolpyruvate carboxykinase (ATP)
VVYEADPVFGFQVPSTCPGVPDQVLRPASSWPSEAAYLQRYRDLAARFVDNFKKFEDQTGLEVKNAGPRVQRER